MFRKRTAGESSGQPFTNCVIFGNVSIVRSTLLKAFTKSRESTLAVAPHLEPTHTILPENRTATAATGGGEMKGTSRKVPGWGNTGS